jgi:hypothetical protein
VGGADAEIFTGRDGPVGVMVLLVLAGCAGARSSTQSLLKPGDVAAQGGYVHMGSGLAFPTEGTAGGARFTRTSITRFDAKGQDVGANYDVLTPSGQMVITAYVYPVPLAFELHAPTAAGEAAARRLDPLLRDAMCHQEMGRREGEITTLHPEAKLIREDTVAVPHDETSVPGAVAVYELRDAENPSGLARSELYVFCYVRDFWVVKYRITPVRDHASKEILADFMRQVPWTR